MKYTLITGATGGLGSAFCTLYAKNNNNLFLVATNQEKLNELKASLNKQFPNVHVECMASDLSDIDECKKVFEYTKINKYFINNLVNNAGFGDRCDFKDMDVDTQIKMVNVNCSALLYFTRVYLTEMLEKNEGHIINVCSIAGFVPGPYMCTYHATKSFVLNLGEAISHEIRKSKVKLLTLCPGPFISGFVKKAKNDFTFKKIKPIPAQKVAEYGYKMSLKGKRVAVVGIKNKLTVFAPRLFPSKFVTKISAGTIKKGD